MSGFKGWKCVAEQLEARVAEAERQSDENALLDEGQRASVRVIAERLCSGREGCDACAPCTAGSAALPPRAQ